jgi:gliding motility-associated-like protein
MKQMLIKKLLLLISVLCFLDNLYAQLCQGSLGDPVVNISFGSGPNTGPALGTSVTNYFYLSAICPNDGYYTIANSTSNCFDNTWLTIPEDHTPGDNSGYMMLINASFAPGDFYVQEVTGLCGGTTYEFAAWMVNVIRPSSCMSNTIKPDITFNIETTAGEVLQTYSTGSIDASSSPVWKQYGLFFTTPVGTTSAVIRITNNAPGGCGNDLALDDITFRPCGPKVSININGAAEDKNVCTGDTASLNFTSTIVGGYVNTFYQWQTSTDSVSFTDIAGANGPVYTNPAIITPGKYYYRLAVAEGNNITLASCKIASEFITVNVVPLPVPSASNTGPACEGNNITLSANGGTNVWTGPGNYLSNAQSPIIPNASLSNNGIYYVTVTSPEGCINTDSTLVVISRNPSVDAGADVDICEGGTVKLQGNTINATSFTWFPVTGLSDPLSLSPVASPVQTTLYTLTASDGVCADSASVLVNVSKKPTANAGPDKAVTGTQTATLEGEVTGSNLTYFWTPDLYLSSDTALTTTVSPPFDTTYTLNVISNIGCGTATDKVLVRYFKEIYVPNAFTPNNDGLNDRWNTPALSAFPLAEVSVYNRYGQMIFYNKGNTNLWDGTFKGMPVSSGVYTYIIDLKNGFKKLYGIVSLLR